MKVNESLHPLPAYTQPEVEILTVQVEKGYLSSFSSGESGGDVATDGDFGWSDDVDF